MGHISSPGIIPGGVNVLPSGALEGKTYYRYDGQMAMEEAYHQDGALNKVTRYGLGGRGIESIETNSGGQTSFDYPIYDGHGNMIMTVKRGAQQRDVQTSRRMYDAWGNVNSGANTVHGAPPNRYCANLGHLTDYDTGLVYMLARDQRLVA